MGVANATGGWVKKGTRFGPSDVITGTSDNPTIEIRDAQTEVWPTPNRNVGNFDVRAGGDPMINTADYVLGRPEPMFSVRCPFTLTNYLLIALSFFQKTSFLATPNRYSITPYTRSNIQPATAGEGGFMTVEAGIGTDSVWRAVGAVCKSWSATIPSVGSDGGRPELSSDWIAANSTRASAFTGTPTVNTDQVFASYNFEWAIAASDSGWSISSPVVVSMDMSWQNAADYSPNIGTTVDAMFLGPLSGSGSVSILLDAVSAGQFDRLMDAYESLDPVHFTLNASAFQSYALLEWDALLQNPTFSVQGNAIVATFPWVAARYTSSGRPIAIIEHATFAWPNQ